MSSTMLTVGRILLASLFLIAGGLKMMGIKGTAGYIASKGLPQAELLTYAAIVFEIGGALLLIINRFTVLVALAFAAFCIFSGIVFHDFWTVADPMQWRNQLNHFLKNVALAGGFLALAAAHQSRTT